MEHSILSDIGSKRKMNQDYAGLYKNTNGGLLFLLADGMGGHNAGDIASQLAVEDLGKIWETTKFRSDTIPDLVEAWLRQNIRYENDNLAKIGSLDDYAGMGTTLEAVFVGQEFIISAHVGDSWTSIVREGKLQKLTSDHSLVQELVDAGEITAEEAINHPNKNIITRSLGQKDELFSDIEKYDIKSGDYLLMNSDGLTNMVSKDEIVEVVNSERTVDEKTKELVRLANEKGGPDNITVILVHFVSSTETIYDYTDDEKEGDE